MQILPENTCVSRLNVGCVVCLFYGFIQIQIEKVIKIALMAFRFKKDTCLLGFTKNYITRRATEHERAPCARQQGFYNQMQTWHFEG